MVERSVRGARASVAWTEVQFKDEHDLTESLYCAPVLSSRRG